MKNLDIIGTLRILRPFDPQKNTDYVDQRKIKKLLFSQRFRY